MSIVLQTDFKTAVRGYSLRIQRNLFGGYAVMRCWYGLHNNRGGHKQQLFDDLDEALTAYRRFAARRLKRGYRAQNETPERQPNTLELGAND